jgi:hypothetical protein
MRGSSVVGHKKTFIKDQKVEFIEEDTGNNSCHQSSFLGIFEGKITTDGDAAAEW